MDAKDVMLLWTSVEGIYRELIPPYRHYKSIFLINNWIKSNSIEYLTERKIDDKKGFCHDKPYMCFMYDPHPDQPKHPQYKKLPTAE